MAANRRGNHNPYTEGNAIDSTGKGKRLKIFLLRGREGKDVRREVSPYMIWIAAQVSTPDLRFSAILKLR